MHRQGSAPLFRIAALVALVGVGAVVMPATATDRVVVVRQGDTLSEIALRNGVSVVQLMALNPIANPNRIYPGQRLRLTSQPAASNAPVAAAAPSKSAPVVHVVQAGEHLTGIAKRYGTTIGAIAKANGIANPSYLRVGKRLTIPGSASTTAKPQAPSSPAAPLLHVVASGETLSGIAERYRTSIRVIAKANGIANPSFLRVGQRLSIPGTTAPASPAGAGMSTGMASLVAARTEIRAIIVAEATTQGVPVAFALAVAWQESGWQSGVVSSAGAVGVMQLTPPTAAWVAGTMLHEKVRLTDARSNIRAGIRLLKHYLARYQNDKALVLAAYYQGQTAADQHGVYGMTRPYIASIRALEAIFAH